jgi:hypothetical protein
MAITRECFNDLSSWSAGLWKKKNRELLSCFRDGEGGIWDVIAAYLAVEPMDPAVAAAMSYDSHNPDWTMMEALELGFNRTFVALWDRGALQRLLLEDEIPERALKDLNRIEAAVEAAKPAPPREVVAPVVQVDPIDVCVREFHEMGSDAFKKKYLDHRGNRVHYEAAIAQGRI